MAVLFCNASDIGVNCIGHIIGLTIRGAGSQWVKLLDIESAEGEKSVKFVVQMLGHNRHMGQRSKTVRPSKRVPYQSIEEFTAWCNANKLDVF